MKDIIQLKGRSFKLFISKEQITQRVQEIADILNQEYRDKNPILMPILNGSFMFVADLIRSIEIECEVSFVKLASYEGTNSAGNISMLLGLDEDLKDRSIILIDDVIETGKTIGEILSYVEDHNPKEISIVSCFVKSNIKPESIRIDHVGFEIPNHFIVGYGLDYNKGGRQLPDVYRLVD